MNKSKKNPVNLLARECMVTALMQLLKEKPLSSISVSELTQKAGVSRMTYYRNYEKKEDIFIFYLDDLVDLYRESIRKESLRENYYDKNNLIHCFYHFQKYRDFLESLFQSGLGHHLLMAISRFVIETWQKPEDGMDHYYELEAFSGTLFNVYISWNLKGAKETPEELAQIIYDIYCPHNGKHYLNE